MFIAILAFIGMCIACSVVVIIMIHSLIDMSIFVSMLKCCLLLSISIFSILPNDVVEWVEHLDGGIVVLSR